MSDGPKTRMREFLIRRREKFSANGSERFVFATRSDRNEHSEHSGVGAGSDKTQLQGARQLGLIVSLAVSRGAPLEGGGLVLRSGRR